MAKLVKHLLCEHEDLSSIPKTSIKEAKHDGTQLYSLCDPPG